MILEDILDELKKMNGNNSTPKIEIRDANNSTAPKKGKNKQQG